ncbi:MULTISPECIES: Rv2175c family DNA-binding protein [unclassified Allobranchiibius]|uniref:Rv2175c family DNA-binding protein n=1 Tax=unclassified Allobranchiibius TaxID=2649857 RepID=UPI001EEEE2AC|nr:MULTISPECIES: Rv2175c family DNA-binding protein [unclassified Allobranchiibius]UIJ33612.1 DNA-binding protein [Allobranchiibius sp. GilTou73]
MADLEDLVGEWLSVPEVAEAIGLRQRQVRKMITDGELLSHRVGPNAAIGVPAAFVRDGEILPSLQGTVTVLRDARLPDEEALEWLFTPDETLPLPGAPIHMLLAGRKAEIRKRASELAF